MLVGIALVGVITAAVATWFVTQDAETAASAEAAENLDSRAHDQ